MCSAKNIFWQQFVKYPSCFSFTVFWERSHLCVFAAWSLDEDSEEEKKNQIFFFKKVFCCLLKMWCDDDDNDELVYGDVMYGKDDDKVWWCDDGTEQRYIFKLRY